MKVKFFYIIFTVLISTSSAFCWIFDNKHIRLGKEWLDIGKNNEAITEFHIALNEEPKSEEARFLLAIAYINQEDISRSLEWRKELISINSSAKYTNKLDDIFIEYAENKYKINDYYTGNLISQNIYNNKLKKYLVTTIDHGNYEQAEDAYNILISNNSRDEVARDLYSNLESNYKRGDDRNNFIKGNFIQLALFSWRTKPNELAEGYLSDFYRSLLLTNNTSSFYFDKIRLILTEKILIQIYLDTLKNTKIETKSFDIAEKYLASRNNVDSLKILVNYYDELIKSDKRCEYYNDLMPRPQNLWVAL